MAVDRLGLEEGFVKKLDFIKGENFWSVPCVSFLLKIVIASAERFPGLLPESLQCIHDAYRFGVYDGSISINNFNRKLHPWRDVELFANVFWNDDLVL